MRWRLHYKKYSYSNVRRAQRDWRERRRNIDVPLEDFQLTLQQRPGLPGRITANDILLAAAL